MSNLGKKYITHLEECPRKYGRRPKAECHCPKEKFNFKRFVRKADKE